MKRICVLRRLQSVRTFTFVVSRLACVCAERHSGKSEAASSAPVCLPPVTRVPRVAYAHPWVLCAPSARYETHDTVSDTDVYNNRLGNEVVRGR